MAQPEIDAVVIGFKSTQEIEEAIERMNRALAAFKLAGGQGIEVVTGRASEDEIRVSQQYAEKHQLYASVGSDFHSPDNPWVELGRLAELPGGSLPVWALF